MSDSHRMLLYQMVRQQVDVKLIYQDFRKSVPKENLDHILESVDGHFDNVQIKALMKRENVTSLSDLETALLAKGSSVKRERKIFQEQFIAQQWAQQQIKPDGEEITHQDMIDWYQAHIKDFEKQPRVRWEELAITFAKHPNREEAYAVLGEMGNRVLAGAAGRRGSRQLRGHYRRAGWKVGLDAPGQPRIQDDQRCALQPARGTA